MKQTIAQLRDWLLEHRFFCMAWLEKDEAYPSEVEEALAELLIDIAERLTKLAKDFPSHPCNHKVIEKAVAAGGGQWQENPNTTSNSLIILSSLMAPVAGILTDSLADWAEPQSLPLKFLDWTERPPSPGDIKSRMNEMLRKTDTEREKINIVVIPNLSWCFLQRSVGLDGIDYLRDD